METNTKLYRETDGQIFEEWLQSVLGKIKGEKIDVAALVYDRIQVEEKPQSAFQYFLENADEIVSTEEEEIEQRFTATEIQQLRRKCDPLMEGVLGSLLSENILEQEFYSRLWFDGICKNSLLQSDEERIYALNRIWQDRRIPYFHLNDGMTMTNEQFMACCDQNKSLIKKAFFIINSSFSQRTQQSDLLLKILSECKDDEDKVVVMAQILGNVEKKVWYTLYDAAKKIKTED